MTKRRGCFDDGEICNEGGLAEQFIGQHLIASKKEAQHFFAGSGMQNTN